MEKITLLINTSKDFDINSFKIKLNQLQAANEMDVLLISYKNKKQILLLGFPVFSVEDHDDVSFSQLLKSISTAKFLFFNPALDYPNDFFRQILKPEESHQERAKGSVWQESLIALQQSHYGLCTVQMPSNKTFDFLNESVLYTKTEVGTLNTDKLSVHPESATELYRYAAKKKLNFVSYAPVRKKIAYYLHFADLIIACQNQAQKQFKLFPAFFVLFFLIFGVGGAFNTTFLLVFIVGMSGYLLAITMESFGLSTIKKNGGLLPILLLLFPFIHLVYGLESIFAKFKKKG